ncbi:MULTISPECIES: ATP-binding protein [Actinoalloteichus]|uniref:ATP-binding protein n=1 Tax=Actinoalloteichus TaxID=65496 RepID=UPI000951ABEC|nr:MULTISPECIES: ATP-binding protein [Actinoalloteichus]
MRDLLRRLAAVEEQVRGLVAARRAADPEPADPYRGLYLSEEAVLRILADRPAPPAGTNGDDRPSTVDDELPATRLGVLARRFGLSRLDVDLLLIALAPDLDGRFERLYAYLNDDVTRRRATVALALELADLPQAGRGRFRLAPDAPLIAGGLLRVEETDRPMLSRSLRVPDRVVAHLLGHDALDADLAGLLRLVATDSRRTGGGEPDALPARLAAVLATGTRLLYLHAPDGDGAASAVATLAAARRDALVIDATRLIQVTESSALRDLLLLVAREARLRGAGLILGPVETLDPARPERRPLLPAFAALAEWIPVLLHGVRGWDPQWTEDSPITVAVPVPTSDDRAALWRDAVAEITGGRLTGAEVPGGLLAGYRLGAEQVRQAARTAAGLAVVDGGPLTPAHLRAGVRAQNAAGLERLARRITPDVGWDDLVLADSTRSRLHELSLRAAHRETVLGRWRMRPGGGRGRGVLALFAGESGTGKTMSAEVLAAQLGLDLYVVDLATVVDKYVGETEKNLERIFTEAAGVNGVLLFDEADAIFGRRSEVKDSHDKHANMESAYLLQRMESFDGIAVLTTNLRANLDEAFIRRLDVVADFPMPAASARLALWDRCLGTRLPRADDIDLPFCAESFELSGGSIRACAISAAYLAAEADRPVRMADLINAVRREYRKLGRLLLDAEFGPWLSS